MVQETEKAATKELVAARELVPTRGTLMYTNGKGTNYSLGIITQMANRLLGSTFGQFTICEADDGELIINTGMKRVRELPAPSKCIQPCSGECETCPSA